MPKRTGAVHVVTTTRHYKGKIYQSHLLCRSYRAGAHVRKETVGNLSHLPAHIIDLIRRALRAEALIPADQFEVVRSVAHGDSHAVLTAIDKLGFEGLLSARRCPEADLVTAMVAARVMAPHTKLATTRWWQTRTLAEDLGVRDASEDDLYAAMDWLLDREPRIEQRLAARHLAPGGLVLYDVSSSYFEGTTCPLAKRGYNRDGKRDKLQVNYGLVTDGRGCPVAVSVFEGNVSDTTTLLPDVQRLRERFGIREVVIVGDRGMIAQTSIDQMKTVDGLAWITALKSPQIQTLLTGGALQLGLFDDRNLFELRHPAYPGERLIACRNPQLAMLRARKRQDLLAATTAELEKVQRRVTSGRLRGRAEIGLRVGRVINKYKVAKHFTVTITDARFDFAVRTARVETEAAIDGVYVIRTNVPAVSLTAADAVRHYKALSQVERAFRSLKTVDLHIRPIHHRLADRVRSHIFLCMLAYYVEWHMREAWRPLLFADEDQAAKVTRDPVAPAKRSPAAEQKAATHQLADGTPVHCFRTLLQDLSSIVRNRCRARGHEDAPTFTVTTTPTPEQRHALELMKRIA
ncbi:MAG TPA: IS1634 family transposase [Gemmatimonadales bacterium]|nr:IS1634 family transposase [Gemmatimonadales bacterium]